MNPIIRNILAVIVGLLVGGFVNSYIVGISGNVIPLPDGVDPNDMESLKAGMQRFEVKHFVMPFLAHALGTLVAGFLAALIGASHQMKLALGAGAFFLLGGIAVNIMLPGPIWFAVLDVVVAYIPMAYLGFMFAGSIKNR